MVEVARMEICLSMLGAKEEGSYRYHKAAPSSQVEHFVNQ